MTDKERLEQLKWRCAGAARVEVDLMQPDNDHDWLIQQAEKLEEAEDLLKQIGETCLCSRFHTNGFDYQEEHFNLGKCRSGARWNTPRDLIKDHFANVSNKEEV